MKLDGKVKGGLAWAGLVVILAVPAANMVVGNPNSGSAQSAVTAADASATKPALKVPAAKPAATDPIETASVADPVDKLLAKGKKLPSYISDGDSASVPKADIIRCGACSPPRETTFSSFTGSASVAWCCPAISSLDNIES